MTQGIYKIEDMHNGVYIGASVNIEQRWQHHQHDLRKNKHKNIILQRAYNKYGSTFFDYTIIEIVDCKEKLNYYEQVWIAIFKGLSDKLYNINLDGRTSKGVKRSDEIKQKLSEIAIGRKRGNYVNKGRPLTKDHAQILSVCSKATSNARALSMSGGKVYTMIDPNNIIYNDVVNIKKFAREHSLCARVIFNNLKNGKDMYKGWKIILKGVL